MQPGEITVSRRAQSGVPYMSLWNSSQRFDKLRTFLCVTAHEVLFIHTLYSQKPADLKSHNQSKRQTNGSTPATGSTKAYPVVPTTKHAVPTCLGERVGRRFIIGL
jgi:hypothetical protein